MSYTAPSRLLLPSRHTIDTANDVWYPVQSMWITGTTTWPTANMAIYQPVRVPCPVKVLKLFFACHSTGTGNVDMGVYDEKGNAVISATETTKLASMTEQVFDVTDTTIGPGRYYIALVCSNNTDTFYYTSYAAPISVAHGVLTEASAYPLPSTATWATNQTLAMVPAVGMTVEATIT